MSTSKVIALSILIGVILGAMIRSCSNDNDVVRVPVDPQYTRPIEGNPEIQHPTPESPGPLPGRQTIQPKDLKVSPSDCLKGLTVVIDPGHGGFDPGASTFLQKRRIAEDEYVYDVACRLRQMVESASGAAILTIEDKKGTKPRDAEILLSDMDEYFVSTEKKVVAGLEGLRTRVQHANHLQRTNKDTVFISLHFDSTAESLHGVSLIAPSDTIPPLVSLLEESFRMKGRLRKKDGYAGEYHAVLKNGDKNHGLRMLYVLRNDVNNVPNRTLIELGNLSNPKDVWRIRSPEVREDYAQAIFLALKEFNLQAGSL